MPAQNRRRRQGQISLSRHAFTACALRLSGTITINSRALRICRGDIEIARVGTSEISANQPSPTCCRRHASSRFTIMYGSSIRKSAGGSLNAMCPFSPIPKNATSIGAEASCLPTSRTIADGSAASPSMQVKVDDSSILRQPLPQKFAETRRMRSRKADVFVQMKCLDTLPSRSPACSSAHPENRTAMPP